MRREKHPSGPAIALACCLALAAPGFADDDTKPEDAHVSAGTEHVEVTGEGGLAGDAPTTFVTVIHPDDYAGQVTNLAELLDRSVGVRVQSFGGLRSFATVSIRGSTSEQVEVLVDGVPLNSPMGGPVNLADIPLTGVEAVEVHRGFAPAGVGASSIGGVINIRTRRPGESKTLTGSLARGSYGSSEATLTADLPGRASRWILSAEGFATEGNFTYLDNNGTNLTNEDDVYTLRRNNRGWVSSLRARGEIPGASGWLLTISTEWTARRHGVPGIDAWQSDSASFSMQRGLVRAEMAWPRLGGGRVDLTAGVDSEYHSETFVDLGSERVTPTLQDSTTRVSGTGATARLVFKPSPAHRISFLVEPRAESAAAFNRISLGGDPIRARRYSLDAVLEDEMHLSRGRFLVSPSLRLDLYDTSAHGGAPGAVIQPAEDPSALSGRLGAAYVLSPHWSLRGNIGEFHRTPSLLELYGNEGTIVGNPGLLAEGGINADAGIELSAAGGGWLRRSAVEIAAFRTDADNLVQLLSLPSRSVKAFNVGRSRVTGVEASVSLWLGAHLNASANVTLQKPILLSDTFERGGDLPGRPRRQAATEVSLALGRATLTHRFTYVGPNEMGSLGAAAANLPSSRLALTRLPARYLHDAILDLSLPGRTHLSLEVDNLFDRHVVDVARYPLPGRTVFLKLRSGF